MKIYHTSPKKIEKIKKYNGVFDSVLFFSNDKYYMNNESKCVYSVNVNESEIIDVEDLEITEEQALDISNVLCIDVDDVEDVIASSGNIIDDCELSWWVQAEQARIAKSMGYVAVRGKDEQGTYYAIDMYGKENMLIDDNDLVLEDLNKEFAMKNKNAYVCC